MPPARPKPPVQKRADVMEEIKAGLHNVSKQDAVSFLLGYFTTIDMVQILADLPAFAEACKNAKQ